MIARLKFVPLLLVLGCVGSGDMTQSAQPAPVRLTPEMARIFADRRLRQIEDDVRLPVYEACGGDRELRCQQFAPEILRAIPPAIALTALRCRETGAYPRRIRACAFTLGDRDRGTVPCTVTLRELPGIHTLYWSHDLPPESSRRANGGAAAVDVPLGRSSLACTGPLLALTREPEHADPAPAEPPRRIADLGGLITPDDYPIPAMSHGQEGVTAMRLQVGSHGRIDRCRVTRSSGSEALDETACTLLRARAFFLPARDARGKAVAADIDYSYRWRRPR
jgi:TonB family protein